MKEHRREILAKRMMTNLSYVAGELFTESPRTSPKWVKAFGILHREVGTDGKARLVRYRSNKKGTKRKRNDGTVMAAIGIV